ncbi:MAG: hypothetical protein CL582_22380 [Alteromonadaceae bacterium]|nr:hypothetical protein [Alteromonadaceae bacterium]
MNSKTRKEVNRSRALTKPSVSRKQLLKKGSCGGWSIKCYKGLIPSRSNKDISNIEFSAHAETRDLSKSPTPNLSDTARSIRVDFDNTSVVVLLSSNFANLVKKLQSVFSGIRWKKENP